MNEIINDNCLIFLPKMENKSVDFSFNGKKLL
jgi:DNA modification methylase